LHFRVAAGIQDGSYWRVPDYRKFHDQRLDMSLVKLFTLLVLLEYKLKTR